MGRNVGGGGGGKLVLSSTECSSDFLIAIVGYRYRRAVSDGSETKGRRCRFMHGEVHVWFLRDRLLF